MASLTYSQIIYWLYLVGCAPLLNIFHPPALFWQLTRLAPFVAHKQKIHQNVRLNLTRCAIIQIFKILIFRDVSFCEFSPLILMGKYTTFILF